MSTPHLATAPAGAPAGNAGFGPVDLIAILAQRWKLLIGGSVGAGAVMLGISFLMSPTFTAQTVFLPPQQQQSAATAAMASLGALAGISGGSLGGKTPADQYIALLRSVNVEERLVERFKLMELYEAKYRFLARRRLEQSTTISLGKKDGLITLEVDAHEPKLAADIANQYVAELRRLIGELALTEAQQRRVFFETELKRTNERLAQAQKTLQSGGFNANAMKAEPRTAAETYARIKAEATSAEVRLQTMRRTLADTSPEVQQQLTMLSALRGQLAQLESNAAGANDSDYLGRYREFKYQEALFEMYSKQFELARLDESREGSVIQVVDVATPPEYKSKPKRAALALGAAVGTFILLSIWILGSWLRRAGRATA